MHRRQLLTGLAATAAVFAADAVSASPYKKHGGVRVLVEPPVYGGRSDYTVPERFKRQLVPYYTNERPGTIVIDPSQRFLYLTLENNSAIRYGVGVGREGFGWAGNAQVKRKQEWPTWTPPAEMIARQPELAKYASGMPGGRDNPLGARALYLYQGNRDTMYRIHGTNEPWTIGQAMSSGCIRMTNENIEDLYLRVPLNTNVVVLGQAV
ncbi:L,D-transpeptidase [Tepidamorphus sp. 3E244]|uniref:L,D-transpeptidase n=1 Tax=Tepidamorphus sp. 3E244 TaxID=3385498 RepID=UPI0038FD13AE